MRIQHKPMPFVGDERTVTKFLWFPKRIEDEERWLETATFVQEFRQIGYGHNWMDLKWCD